jgi:hypothetical protein
MTEFYMTLLSNSSMDFFPDNKTGNFTVQLPKPMILEGQWKMALTECHYQYNFLNVSKNNKSTQFVKDKQYYECEIPEGYYAKIEDIIEKLNEVMVPYVPNGFIEIDTSTKYVKLTDETTELLQYIKFEDRLAIQLGYDPYDTEKPKFLKSIQPADASRGIPDEILVYCDIIEPQIIGDEMAKIIRIVDISKKDTYYGQPFQKEFQRLHYLNISKKSFSNISIELRDKTGKFLPFVSGIFTCVFHLKKFSD